MIFKWGTVKLQSGNHKVSSFFETKESPIELQVTNAEVLFTNFLIEHNVPIAVSDHAGSVIILSISLLKYLFTRGYSWVLTSLLPSVAQAYGVFCSFSAIELVVSLARLPIIAEVKFYLQIF
jgi:hypothetical protein